ncbi:MAG: hypothetical protein WBA67_05225 [Jannaschia sp.]
MVLMVLETEALADEALPLAQLAAHMRLAEGYAAIPGQDERLRQRLRAAIATLERRLGKILIAREVVLTGTIGDALKIGLPIAPVQAVVRVDVLHGGVATPLEGVRIEQGGVSPCLVLPRRVPSGASVHATLLAGWGAWEAIPEPLAEAVLLTAEALDAGEDTVVGAMVASLIAPFRLRRLGGVR